MSRETIMIIFQPGYWRTWTNHISVWHYVASLATDNVNLLLKCYSRSRTSILRIVTSSVFTWICMLSLVCINISHLVSGFCPGQWHCVQPRDSQLLHITFMTFLCLRLYYNILLMWLVETFQQQATVIICIKAQIVLAGVSSKQAGPTPTYHCTGNTGMFKLNKIKCLCRETGVAMTRPVSAPRTTPRHLINLHVTIHWYFHLFSVEQ